ncbi:MAG: EamA family transporter RarD [Thermoflexales bacterium]
MLLRSSYGGILLAAGAYLAWGFLPLYLRLLRDVPPLQLLAHRVVWALGFCAVVMTLAGAWSSVLRALRARGVLLSFALSAALLMLTWLTYIWAVNNDHTVEASLGYFITPLVNVALGVILLKERPSAGQWVAILIAAVGVAYLALAYGAFPWIGLLLGVSFSVYGLLRKRAPLGSLAGLTVETALSALVAAPYLTLVESSGQGIFVGASPGRQLLLLAAGVVTAVPLLLFAASARRMPLTVLGVLQYLSPTIQFLVGVLVFNEPFNQQRLLGFGIIWLSLLFFTVEGIWRSQQHLAALRATAPRACPEAK